MPLFTHVFHTCPSISSYMQVVEEEEELRVKNPADCLGYLNLPESYFKCKGFSQFDHLNFKNDLELPSRHSVWIFVY